VIEEEEDEEEQVEHDEEEEERLLLLRDIVDELLDCSLGFLLSDDLFESCMESFAMLDCVQVV